MTSLDAPTRPVRVAVVADDDRERTSLRHMLASSGVAVVVGSYDVGPVVTGADADVVVLDLAPASPDSHRERLQSLPDGLPTVVLGDDRATAHVARAEVGYWLDEKLTAQAEGVQKQIHEAAATALEPYRRSGRLDAFDTLAAVPGVRALDQQGHTAGHSGYLFAGGDRPVLFWGDTIHSHTVQLPCPHVSIAIDSDEPRAVEARARILGDVATRGWWVAASHLPFPGLGRLRRTGEGYGWAPLHFKPLDLPD
jgi:glyoxylase-like metal-dependent hydrolase (beta-lactamase superfamily II)